MFMVIDLFYVDPLTQPRRTEMLVMVGDDRRVGEKVQSCNRGEI